MALNDNDGVERKSFRSEDICQNGCIICFKMVFDRRPKGLLKGIRYQTPINKPKISCQRFSRSQQEKMNESGLVTASPLRPHFLSKEFFER